jgi:hypothetical protein
MRISWSIAAEFALAAAILTMTAWRIGNSPLATNSCEAFSRLVGQAGSELCQKDQYSTMPDHPGPAMTRDILSKIQFK